MPHNGAVLVIGATGQQGGAVARHLLDRGRSVRALVRDPSAPAAQALRRRGAVLVAGALDDAASIRGALAGVDAAFLMLTPAGPDGVAGEERRGKHVADLVRELGIAHLVYSSVGGAERHTGIPHFESKARIEEHIADLDIPATILRPVFLMENFTTTAVLQAQNGDVVLTMALEPGTTLQMIAADDVGAIAADAFQRPGETIGTALEIAGDEGSGAQLAETFGAAYGMPGRFRSLSIDQLRGLPGRRWR